MPSCERKNLKVDPLQAEVHLSAYGNLTISFNKPIIVPPLRVDPYKSKINRRLDNKHDIKEVMWFKVNSEIYDEDSEETKIEDYYLTRMDERAMDI